MMSLLRISPYRKAQLGWVLYDFANTIFSMNIITYFFSAWLIEKYGVEDIFFSIAYSLSMAVAAVTMPALGRLADLTGTRLLRLRQFTIMCVLSTFIIGVAALLPLGLVPMALITLTAFAFANYFFEGSLTYYNALLGEVSTPATVGKISGIGTGVGYAGSITGLLLVWPLTGLAIIPGVDGSVYTFIPTALLFGVFAIPIFLWVKEQRLATVPIKEGFFAALGKSLRETRNYPGLLRFMIGNFLIADAVNTVILFMSVYSESVVGFQGSDKLILFIISTAVALIGSIRFGYLTDRIGAKSSLLLATGGWVVTLLAGVLATEKSTFFIIGGLVGVFLGAVWTTSRPWLNALAPAEKHGQFYGVYTLCSKAAAIFGPLIWGIVALVGKPDRFLGAWTLDLLAWFGVNATPALAGGIHHRLALLAQVIPMILGFLVLLKVPNRRQFESRASLGRD